MGLSLKILLKRNPFFRGMVRIVDFGCRFDHERDSYKPIKSDWDRIGEDWKNVGKDFNVAIEKFKKEHVAAK